MRIVHVITGLESGGAEHSMRRLIGSQAPEVEARVISLSGDGPVGELLRADGIPIDLLKMGRTPLALNGVIKLANLLTRIQPDVVQTWMYHSNLFGGLAAALAGVPVVWGLHQASLSSHFDKRSTRLISSACAVLSRRLPVRIICCGESVRSGHARAGYSASRMVVVPNGLDTDVFRPDVIARRQARAELCISDEETVIGFVGRMNPLKHPENFLRAAAILVARGHNARFVMAGAGLRADNQQILGELGSLGVDKRVTLLGPRRDVPQLMNAFDIFVLSSRVEGLPNVVAEAMATGVPCVVTDVGDAGIMVGSTGKVVPPESPVAIADALESLMADRSALNEMGAQARARAIALYGLRAASIGYRSVYESVLKGTTH